MAQLIVGRNAFSIGFIPILVSRYDQLSKRPSDVLRNLLPKTVTSSAVTLLSTHTS